MTSKQENFINLATCFQSFRCDKRRLFPQLSSEKHHSVGLVRSKSQHSITKERSLCSGHTSATTWNSAKSEGTASDECAWCESRKSKCLDQTWRGKRFFGQIDRGIDNEAIGFHNFLGWMFERQAEQTGRSASLASTGYLIHSKSSVWIGLKSDSLLFV